MIETDFTAIARRARLVGAAIALAGVTAFAAPALAQSDPGPAPDAYEAVDYIESRLSDPRGARMEIVSAPYPVSADFGRYGELDAWAVDVEVRARSAYGGYGGTMMYTVIFVDGEPVALEDDGIDLDAI